jgi:hypothetical protein
MGKVTNSQIQNFRDTATLFLKYSQSEKTKVHLAADKMVKKLKSAHEAFVDDQSDYRAERAHTDDKKVLTKDQHGQYQYEVEDEKELRKSLRILANKEIDITEHFVNSSEIPPNLSFKYEGADGREYRMSDYDVRSAFTGIIIKPEEETE